MLDHDTIVAIATPVGSSAISIIRISGKDSISIIDHVFRSIKNGKKLIKQLTHTIHLGYIQNDSLKNFKKNELDQVMVSVFRNPTSYTGENMIEIYCHGSHYIQNKILQLLMKKGMRLARPGEFTLRAFLNKKLDLTQAEAIADLIRSESQLIHDITFQQIKGSLNKEINSLKKILIDLISLFELELNFSEENLIHHNNNPNILLEILKNKLNNLVDSFSSGNAIKNGINVVIIGNTNVGKSTFFNQILQEERSIVSPIQGTTRDFVEGSVILDGIVFRFFDTAGIRDTINPIEIMGIKKTVEKIINSQVIFYIFDSSMGKKEQKNNFDKIYNIYKKYSKKLFIVIANKSDISNFKDFYNLKSKIAYFFEISAKNRNGIPKVLNFLSNFFIQKLRKNKIFVTQFRHYEALNNSLKEVSLAMNLFKKNYSEDLIVIHLNKSLNFLNKITGDITNEDILNNIFSKFCIGK